MAFSLVWFDGFDDVDEADLKRRYNTGAGWTVSTSTRFSTGNCIGQGGGGTSLQKAITAAQSVVMGFAFYHPYNEFRNVAYLSYSGTTHIRLTIDTDNRFRIYRDGTLLGTGSYVYALGSWVYLELGAKIDDSSGEVVLRVNGNVTDISLTGQDTRNGATAAVDTVALYTHDSSQRVDDWSVWTAAGDSPSTGLPGDLRVRTKAVTSDAAVAFARSAGSDNFANVDEMPSDEDSTYNSSATAGDIDRFGFSAFTVTGAIKAVSLSMMYRKDDAGSRTIRQFLRTGGASPTVANGETKSCSDSYQNQVDIIVTNPETGAPFASASELNACTIGYELVS